MRLIPAADEPAPPRESAGQLRLLPVADAESPISDDMVKPTGKREVCPVSMFNDDQFGQEWGLLGDARAILVKG